MIKRLAKWILRRQIQHDENHLKRLQGYCIDLGLVSSKIEPDLEGKDQSYEIQRAFDVFGGVQLAVGTFHTISTMEG